MILALLWISAVCGLFTLAAELRRILTIRRVSARMKAGWKGNILAPGAMKDTEPYRMGFADGKAEAESVRGGIDPATPGQDITRFFVTIDGTSFPVSNVEFHPGDEPDEDEDGDEFDEADDIDDLYEAEADGDSDDIAFACELIREAAKEVGYPSIARFAEAVCAAIHNDGAYPEGEFRDIKARIGDQLDSAYADGFEKGRSAGKAEAIGVINNAEYQKGYELGHAAGAANAHPSDHDWHARGFDGGLSHAAKMLRDAVNFMPTYATAKRRLFDSVAKRIEKGEDITRDDLYPPMMSPTVDDGKPEENPGQ